MEFNEGPRHQYPHYIFDEETRSKRGKTDTLSKWCWLKGLLHVK